MQAMNDLSPRVVELRPDQRMQGGPLEEMVILGQPSLQQHLDFMREIVVGGDAMDPRVVCDEWRRVNDIYHELEQSEAGIADEAECRDLDPALEPLAEALR